MDHIFSFALLFFDKKIQGFYDITFKPKVKGILINLFQALAYSSYLYLIHQFLSKHIGNSAYPKAEVFDPVNKSWKQLPQTHFARSNPVLAPYRGKLYVFGGEGNSSGQARLSYFFLLSDCPDYRFPHLFYLLILFNMFT